jgi:hypothetical protein
MNKSPRYYVGMFLTLVGTVLMTDVAWNTNTGINSLKSIFTDFRFYIGLALIVIACLLPLRGREKDLKQ